MMSISLKEEDFGVTSTRNASLNQVLSTKLSAKRRAKAQIEKKSISLATKHGLTSVADRRISIEIKKDRSGFSKSRHRAFCVIKAA
jgi:hypothetical protein